MKEGQPQPMTTRPYGVTPRMGIASRSQSQRVRLSVGSARGGAGGIFFAARRFADWRFPRCLPSRSAARSDRSWPCRIHMRSWCERGVLLLLLGLAQNSCGRAPHFGQPTSMICSVLYRPCQCAVPATPDAPLPPVGSHGCVRLGLLTKIKKPGCVRVRRKRGQAGTRPRQVAARTSAAPARMNGAAWCQVMKGRCATEGLPRPGRCRAARCNACPLQSTQDKPCLAQIKTRRGNVWPFGRLTW